MKKLSLLMYFGIAAAGMAHAQTDSAGGKPKTEAKGKGKTQGKGQEMGKGNAWKNPEVRADSNARRMQRNVGLNQAQYEQVKAANLEYYNAVAANRETYKGDQAAMKAANKTAYDTREAKIKSILTPEQYTALQKYRSDIKAKKAKGKSEGKGKPAGKGKPEKKEKPEGGDGADEDELED